MAVAASAFGAGGGQGPRFRSCVGSGHGCAVSAAGPLTGATGLAVAPDGKHVYVASFSANKVAAFAVGGGGNLRFDGCVAEEGEVPAGCATAPKGTLEEPAGLAAGRGALFVSGEGSDTVTRLALQGGGAPSFAGCVAAAAGPCGGTPLEALRGPLGLNLGPGARDLYVASTDAGTITRLRVGGGGLAYAGCLAYGGAFGCGRVRKNSLGSVDSLAVAPGGRAAYAVAFGSAAVTELRRSPSGALSYRGCVGDAGAAGCRALKRGTVSAASGVAVAPDGDDVFVVSQVGTVTRFSVARSGRLAFAGCVGDRGLEGCEPVPRRTLEQASGIAVAPDGKTLYVAALGSNSLVELAVPPRGAPKLAGCVGPAKGCASAPRPATRGAYAVALAPDGRSIYVGAGTGAAVSSFVR
jgi:DNA-binding beta-propeller fold protein YncE